MGFEPGLLDTILKSMSLHQNSEVKVRVEIFIFNTLQMVHVVLVVNMSRRLIDKCDEVLTRR